MKHAIRLPDADAALITKAYADAAMDELYAVTERPARHVLAMGIRRNLDIKHLKLTSTLDQIQHLTYKLIYAFGD